MGEIDQSLLILSSFTGPNCHLLHLEAKQHTWPKFFAKVEQR